MGIAILLLGLVPLMFLPELMGHDDEDDTDPPESDLGAGDPAPGDGSDLCTGEVAEPGEDLSDATTATGVLTPVNDDDEPDAGNQVVDPATILKPFGGDDTATASDGNEGEVLQPVDQVESDQDIIYVDANADAGLAYAEIENFEAGKDVLQVSIAPEMVTGDLDLNVTTSNDGLHALVYIEQQLVAVLKNAPDASCEDVKVIVEQLVA